ncbi:MAG: hypothetical protein WDO13_03125 [Verrucomicrobiota bacterium]
MKLIRYQTTPFYTPASYPSLLDEMDRLFDVAFPALSSLQRGQRLRLAGPVPGGPLPGQERLHGARRAARLPQGRPQPRPRRRAS